MDLLDIEAAAQRLGISPCSLRRWTHQRRIPFIRMGRTIRFSPQALDSFVLSNVVEPTESVIR